MASIQETLALSGVPVYRLVKKARDEPNQYITFQRTLIRANVAANDVVTNQSSIYKVNLFSKDDFEALLDTTTDNLKAAGFLVNSVDTEQYENDTGYYMVPLTVEEVHEKE